MEDESVPGSDTQLTVRIMSTCGSAYGWKAADIQVLIHNCLPPWLSTKMSCILF
jgi:hypothetical protein